MHWKSNLNYSPAGMALVEISKVFLIKYFGHQRDRVDEIITNFFERYKHIDEEYVHHNSAWQLANNIHYTMHEGGELGEVTIWQVEVNNSLNPPDWALDYMKKRYWGRFDII